MIRMVQAQNLTVGDILINASGRNQRIQGTHMKSFSRSGKDKHYIYLVLIGRNDLEFPRYERGQMVKVDRPLCNMSRKTKQKHAAKKK